MNGLAALIEDSLSEKEFRGTFTIPIRDSLCGVLILWRYPVDFVLRQSDLSILLDGSAWLTTSIVDWALMLAVRMYTARPYRQEVR